MAVKQAQEMTANADLSWMEFFRADLVSCGRRQMSQGSGLSSGTLELNGPENVGKQQLHYLLRKVWLRPLRITVLTAPAKSLLSVKLYKAAIGA